MRNKNRRAHPSFNVIYFLDGGKTRTFKTSPSVIKYTILALILLVLWASVAVVLCVLQMKKIGRLSERLEKTLLVIFENEFQKGNVYENLYEAKKDVNLAKKTDSNVSNSIDASKKKVINLLEMRQFKASSQDSIKSPIVDNPVFTRNKDQITLSFTIKNNKHQGRSEGVIWMVMEWVNSDGTILKVSTQGEQETYSIRQQKLKKFTFKAPNSTAILSKLELCFKNREGQDFQFQILPKDQAIEVHS